MELKKGLRGFMLADHRIYGLFKRIILPRRSVQYRVDQFIRPHRGARILDIGCGTADILDFLPEVEYAGFDPNPRYIAAARRRHGRRAEFVVASIEDYRLQDPESYDIVLADGVLHHLDTPTAGLLLQTAKTALKPHGMFVSFDPVILARQHPMAGYLISRDRGRNVRAQEGYVKLIRTHFPVWELFISHDALRVPYDHCVINAWKNPPEHPIRPFSELEKERGSEAK
jgi:SAM-dependent methyltransferase